MLHTGALCCGLRRVLCLLLFLPMNKILIIAHAPFAQALRACAMHVFPDCAKQVLALDVSADEPVEKIFEAACALAPEKGHDLLVLTS